jgi:hypothetical protein
MDDRPRLLKDPQQIDLRLAELSKPHIKPLADFAANLRERGYGEVPDFDPWDGGIAAKALFLLEKPGAKKFKSGFISRNNNDKTAENTFKFMMRAEIPREKTCLWNIVPGWNGTRKITAAELSKGADAMYELLNRLSNVRVVVLVGKRALRGVVWDQRSSLVANY